MDIILSYFIYIIYCVYIYIPIHIPILYEYINNISPARFEKITDFLQPFRWKFG